ncbi:MAG: hypothetical protein H7Z42_13620 [Roseiflexaceae bacterium]|nr:hypothetical protein [Roseiflexaceae bacterium]
MPMGVRMRRIMALLIIGSLLLVGCGGQIGPGNDPNFSFSTARTSRPDGSACLGGEGQTVAKELINIRTFEIVIGGGSNPMSDADWPSFRPRLPWSKNSTRYLLFNKGCFFRSPGVAANCVGDACVKFVEEFDHTWLLLTNVANATCLPDTTGCQGDQVKPGFMSVNTIDKCQQLAFNGPTIYELSDPAGNRYVMHATATGTPDTSTVQLPSGWQLQAKTIDATLVIEPVGGDNGCYYNIVRDNLVQSYHQYVYAGAQWP